MLGLKDEWQILKTGKRSDFMTIAAITATFILVVALNIFFIFRVTAQQTEKIGRMELESIRSELQETISIAESMTLRVAGSAEQLLASGASQETIRKFFNQEQRSQKLLSKGECFNVYIANKDWAIIPEFDTPANFDATKKNWYIGAAERPGKIFITEPYGNAEGHGLCFTVSLMLSDKNTVFRFVMRPVNIADVHTSDRKIGFQVSISPSRK